jgi:ketosteroid isomerase-like protein
MATADVNGIAKEIEAGFAVGPAQGMVAMATYYADVMEQRHVPPQPTDGPVDGRKLREGHALHASSAKDVPGSHEAKVRVEGDDIVVDMASNSAQDGEPYTIRTTLVLEVRGGQIVTFEGRQSPEDRALAWKLSAERMVASGTEFPKDYAEEGGLEIPPDIIAAFKAAGRDMGSYQG